MAIFYSKQDKNAPKKKYILLHKKQKNYKILFYISLLGNIFAILTKLYPKFML